jgi:hypothetical protein
LVTVIACCCRSCLCGAVSPFDSIGQGSIPRPAARTRPTAALSERSAALLLPPLADQPIRERLEGGRHTRRADLNRSHRLIDRSKARCRRHNCLLLLCASTSYTHTQPAIEPILPCPWSFIGRRVVCDRATDQPAASSSSKTFDGRKQKHSTDTQQSNQIESTNHQPPTTTLLDQSNPQSSQLTPPLHNHTTHQSINTDHANRQAPGPGPAAGRVRPPHG